MQYKQRSILFSLSLALCSTSVATSSSHSTALTGFLTRINSTLIDGGKSVRFAGINTYWLGLDENEGGVEYPTHFRITDVMQTISGWLGPTLVRAHTVGISTGNEFSFEPKLGVFNDSALSAADWAIAEAERLGLRLIVPLTDNWKYYHGGKHSFTDWLGLPESDFYTNPQAISAFQDYISHRLLHVNAFTGRAAKDEPAIAMWETGNELDSPTAWVDTIATFIKSIDTNHLVLDGNNPVDVSHLSISNVDAVSSHFYPPNAANLAKDAAAAYNSQKVYSAGEFGWTEGDSERKALLDECLAAPACANAAPWSLFPHADTFGFVDHSDGFTIHYPGTATPDQANFVLDMVSFATSMYGTAPILTSPAIPSIMIINSTSITWRGAALSASYDVQIADSESGPWKTVTSEPGPNDLQVPFTVPGGVKTGQWVRARGVGLSSLLGEWSLPVQK